MASAARILLIDDHALVRDGLRRIIEDEAGLTVVAEASTAGEGFKLALAHQPDLVILDISLPDGSGLDLLPRLRQELPRGRLLVVSMHRRCEDIVDAFEAGATGYVTKESVSENLLAGIRDVLAGESYLDPSVSKGVLTRLLEGKREKKIVEAGYGSLTRREQEVMCLLAEGHSSKAIAERLGVSPKTVDTHRTNIMRKLPLDTTVDIVRYAVRMGLIDLDAWSHGSKKNP